MVQRNGLRSFAMHMDDAPATITAAAETALGKLSIDKQPTDAGAAARAYLEQIGRTGPAPLGQDARARSVFKLIDTELIPLTGTTAVKFRQQYLDVPIYGSLVTVELDEVNRLVSINAATTDEIDVDPVATLSPSDAWRIAQKIAGYEIPEPKSPRLFYFFDEKWRLAYVVENITRQPEPKSERAGIPEVYDYVIDAHTGEVVATLPRSQSASIDVQDVDELEQTRTFRCAQDGARSYLHDDSMNVHTFDYQFSNIYAAGSLPGEYVENPPQPWARAGVSAHANAAAVASFLRDVLRRNGLDNQGGRIVSSVNCVEVDGEREWRNAAWVGSLKQMVYGQRSINGTLRSYAAARDVVAHELFHGVIDHTARLVYRGEPGALNESYSDIFAIIVTNFDLPIDEWDWRLGEDLEGTGLPLRDLSSPRRHGQPEHMNDYVVLPLDRNNDYGGVHINSGIHNKAAYNLITTRDSAGDFMFTARDVAALFYITLTQHLSRTSLFAASRRGAEVVARSLFRNDLLRDDKVTAISTAFEAVGIS